jgi:hypothetical protein
MGQCGHTKGKKDKGIIPVKHGDFVEGQKNGALNSPLNVGIPLVPCISPAVKNCIIKKQPPLRMAASII